MSKLSKDQKATIYAWAIIFIILMIGIGIYIAAMKFLPCEFFLRVGDSPVRCLEL